MADIELKDYGQKPFVCDLDAATLQNPNYRTTLWTGFHVQLTLMCIPPGGDIGLEVHPDNDQFLKIEGGKGRVQLGDAKDNLTIDQEAGEGWAVFVPAGTWHNVTNNGTENLKVYSIYGPVKHPFNTAQATKAIAEADGK